MEPPEGSSVEFSVVLSCFCSVVASVAEVVLSEGTSSVTVVESLKSSVVNVLASSVVYLVVVLSNISLKIYLHEHSGGQFKKNGDKTTVL